MAMHVTVECGRQWPDEIARLLRSLPEWFGIEQSIVEYTDAARTLPTTVALNDGEIVGEVKTRGPSGESEPDERTRAFYHALGFLPLEERFDIWGPDDPCLICVKPLG